MPTITAAEARALQRKPKRSKYGAQKTVLDGITFDSKAEANYYAALKLREKAGEVGGVELQRPFPLMVASGIVVGSYRADFAFWDHKEDRFRVIDVKGFDTPLSKWKRKHVKAQYGLDVEIVR
jgi:hypothetical protein